MTHSLAVVATALLFGGMTLYSFTFAAFLFKALPAPVAGTTLRKAFPLFYLFVIVTSAIAAFSWWSHDATSAIVTGAVALTTLPIRQLLMPAINQATDSGDRLRFKWLHGASVIMTLSHIIASGWLLVRIL
jgi:ABC-type transport system involved in multi-copper enzyme maturation permease subunit